MNKGIVVLMVGMCALLGGTIVFLQMKEDKQPPTIQFQDNEVTYTDGDGYGNLLEGVTAWDDRDGDVTDTLVVESVYPENNGDKAIAVYVARDKSNNIRKLKREVAYMENGQNLSSDTGDNDDIDEQSVTPIPEPDAGNTDEDMEDNIEETGGDEDLQSENHI